MSNYRKKLARKLKTLRGKKSQDEFGAKIGVSQSTLNRIELGEQNVTIDTLETICTRLKCKASDLLDN